MTRSAFHLPDLGEGLEDAEIVEWHAEVGDQVALNQPLCTVETAKAEVVLPSPHAGLLVSRNGVVGDTVAVGAVLVEVETGPGGAEAGEGPASASSLERSEGAGAREPVLVGYGAPVQQSPRRRRASTVARPALLADNGPAGSSASIVDWGAVPRAPRPLAKPPVRLLARRLGVDLASIRGTGPHGTISRADVEGAASSLMVAAEAGAELVPVRGTRRAIAERLTVSHREIPAASTSLWVDFSAVLRARDSLRDLAGPDVSETPGTFPIFCRLVVLALGGSRRLNASFDGAAGVIRLHEAIHLGIAAATERGLLVPVIRDAHQRDLFELSAEIDRLAGAARAGTATVPELTGSTFTITNFGSFGVDEGEPIINHPEAAILGLGAVRDRPWVVDGSLSVRPVAKVTVVFDHRVSDGAEAATFLTVLASMLESVTPEDLAAPP